MVVLGLFYSHPVVFVTSEGELIATILALLSSAALLAGVVRYMRSTRCDRHDCLTCWMPIRRHGAHPYGHMNLCPKHHPEPHIVKKIGAEHVQAEAARLHKGDV